MSIVLLAMGSNLGDRSNSLRCATHALIGAFRGDLRMIAVSSLYESAPMGGPTNQSSFLNCVMEVETAVPAHALLLFVEDVETRLGRERIERWGPRTIDVDIILYGDLVVDEPDLKIPHPRMHERRFVLEPLCEIAADIRHPVLGMTIRELNARAGIRAQDVQMVQGPGWWKAAVE